MTSEARVPTGFVGPWDTEADCQRARALWPRQTGNCAYFVIGPNGAPGWSWYFFGT